MSRLTDFAQSQFREARAIIGSETVSIAGGTALSAVLNEADRSRNYEGTGWDQVVSLDAVVSSVDWAADYPEHDGVYFGKTATARGQTFRVGGIRHGQGFVTIRLTSEKKGA